MTAPAKAKAAKLVSDELTPRTRVYIAALLAAIALAIYSNSFVDGFALDSSFILLRDPRIQNATAQNLKLILTQDYWYPNFHSGLFRPFTTLTFLFNYAILGNAANPVGYHAVNLLLHIGNAWLLFALFWRFLRRAWPAFFAAALWTAHPIATEGVTNLVGRCDELASMAILGGMFLYIRSAQATGAKRWAAAVGLFAISMLGLFSKELGVTSIAMMALWDIVRGPGSWREWARQRWPYYAAVAVSLAIFFAARALVIGTAAPAEFPTVDNPLVTAPFWVGRLTAFKVLLLDLHLLVFPWGLSCDRSYNQIPLAAGFDIAAWGGLLLALTVLAVAIARRKKDPMMFWCVGFFGIALLPVSNLAITIGSIMAERFLYLPAAAFAIAVTVLISRSPFRARLPLILGTAIALFGLRTFLRNPDWRDDYALSAHDVQVTPASFKLHGLLAKGLMDRSPANIDQAVAEGETAWEIVRQLPPMEVFTQTPANLGKLYAIKGDAVGGPRTPRGVAWYRKAVPVLEEGARDSRLYGDAYDKRQEAHGKPAAVRLERAELYLNLGAAYHGLGMFAQARDAYVYGRKLSPADLGFYNAIAANYLDGGNPGWAAVTLEEKMMLDGGQPDTVASLRKLLEKIPNSSCALVDEGGRTKLNVSCPALNMCLTWVDLAQTYYQGRKAADAGLLKKEALEHGCAKRTLDMAVPE